MASPESQFDEMMNGIKVRWAGRVGLDRRTEDGVVTRTVERGRRRGMMTSAGGAADRRLRGTCRDLIAGRRSRCRDPVERRRRCPRRRLERGVPRFRKEETQMITIRDR